jgi:membrane protease YdiL (CAAX protease family)
MLIECVLLAIPLIVLTLLISSTGTQGRTGGIDQTNQCNVSPVVCYNTQNENITPPVNGNEDNGRVHSLLANIVTGIGAGIYEELVFRLILICLLIMLFQDAFKLSHENAIVLSIMISAALFSAHHHIDFLSGQPNANDPFDLSEFVFRTIAGIYFAILYAIRGFGITAGTHAFYNIIAVSITAFFFPG